MPKFSQVTGGDSADRSFSRRFTVEQERQFEADLGGERARSLARRGLLGLILYIGYLGIDALQTPDVLGYAVALRLGVVTPLALAAVLLVRMNPSIMVREGLMAFITVVASIAGVAIMAASHSPLREHQHHAYILLTLYVVVVLRLRLGYALAACMAFLALEALSITMLPEADPAGSAADLIVLTVATVLCMMAAGSFDHYMRAAYFYNRQQRQRTERLEDLSRHDPLTGLGNRRALEDAVARFAEGTDDHLAVIVADIDHFKAYNDALGHQAGDACLRRVAELMEDQLRSGDDVAIRFGGEEFLIMMPHAELGTAQIVAERMRRSIQEAAIAHPGRAGGVLTSSFGVAAGSAVAGIDPIIAAADSALYAAKSAGRNQVWPRRRVPPGEGRLASSA